MQTLPAVRPVVLLGLVVALVGLGVWYGSLAPDPSVGAYPGTDELGHEYDRSVGERVAVGGRVVATEPIVIAAEDGVGGALRLTVVEVDRSIQVTPGDHLRVYGVAEPDGTIRALNAVAVPWYGRWYAWSVSFLAGLWVLARIVRHWRLDRRTWTLRRRATPLGGRAWLRSRLAAVSEDA